MRSIDHKTFLWIMAVCLIAVCCLAPAGALASDEDARQPVPDAAAQSAALAHLKEQFNFAELRKNEEPSKLARSMLEQAAHTADNPPLKYVLFRQANEFAVDAHDPALAMETVDEVAKCFEVDVLAAKTSALQKIFKGSTSSEAHGAELVDALADEALAADRYEIADNLAAISERLAGNDAELKKKQHLRRSALRAMALKFTAVEKAITQLETIPDDADLNFTVGKYRAFQQGDWRRGIPMLALGSDRKIAAVAQRELHPPEDPAEQKALADQWWDIASTEYGLSKKTVQGHAVDWYRKALPGLNGLDRLAVEKRLPPLPRVNLQKLTGVPVKIINVNSGLALGIMSSNKRWPSVKQHQFTADALGLQWKLQPLKEGYYKLVNMSNDQMLASAHGGTESGNRTILYPYNESSLDQQWKLEPTADGAFHLVNRKSNLLLTVNKRADNNSSDVRQLELMQDDPPEQHWRIVRANEKEAK
ncbi:MAG: RICIN domain-containing protein [Planctomycetia bacterium]|nr:RICIN domain-containing protein [Planctomycetia bacterium]